jgi:hypothetical protein
MPIVIPFQPSRSFYDLETVIGGNEYLFDVKWNPRANIDPDTLVAAGAWAFDLYDGEGNAIVTCVPIVCGAYLGRTADHALFRNGVIVAVDTERRDNIPRDPGLDDIGEGKRVEVRYYTMAEVFGADPDAAVL